LKIELEKWNIGVKDEVKYFINERVLGRVFNFLGVGEI
jgi:hypothetical protein